MSSIIPIPRQPVAVRPATPADLPFIDGLQKVHTHMVGWMPTKQIEGKIAARHVLVAWAPRPCSSQDMGEAPMPREEPVGYAIGHDQYFKRDDVGIIYQMNVAPGKQRGLIGATLLKAMFDRAAYGCRLFCCWCAQDIEANRFWESMGFVPLAYRAGSRGKRRVHIFWQRRVRAGDTTTPYWFPSQTSAGSIREDRLVLPIPPGTHWSDEMPVMVLPGEAADEPKRIAGPKAKAPPAKKPQPKGPLTTAAIGMRFAPTAPPPPMEKAEKPKREKKPKVKNDPKLVAAARELRDRWLERVNTTGLLAHGKYDVSRALEEAGAGALAPPTLVAENFRGNAPALPAPEALPAAA